MRTWPFRDWHLFPDDGFKRYGWAPVPEDQVVLAESLSAEGIDTNIVTDTLHLYRAFYESQRGSDAFYLNQPWIVDRFLWDRLDIEPNEDRRCGGC